MLRTDRMLTSARNHGLEIYHTEYKYMIVRNQRKKEYRIMKKTVISVVGKDKVGILFNVCKYLAGNHINILDIAQTIV